MKRGRPLAGASRRDSEARNARGRRRRRASEPARRADDGELSSSEARGLARARSGASGRRAAGRRPRRWRRAHGASISPRPRSISARASAIVLDCRWVSVIEALLTVRVPRSRHVPISSLDHRTGRAVTRTVVTRGCGDVQSPDRHTLGPIGSRAMAPPPAVARRDLRQPPALGPAGGARGRPRRPRSSATASFWTAETTGTEAFSPARRGRGRPRRRSTSAPACSPSSSARRWSSPWPAPRCRRCTPTATSCSASASRRRSSPSGGTASPYGDRPLARSASTSRSCKRVPHRRDGDASRATSTTVSRFRLGVRLGERRPKIVIGALNAGMLRLAGEVADGVLLNYLPASPRAVVGRAGRGERAATADASTPTSTPACAERERRHRAAPAATCSPTPSSTPTPASFERAGFGDEVADDPRAPRGRRPRGRRRRRVSDAHGRRHRRHGRRRPRARRRCGPTSTPASRCRC